MHKVGVLSVGFGNYVSFERVIAVTSAESLPMKRAIQHARENGLLIDATTGRKTKSVLFMDDGHLVTSGLSTDTLVKRIEGSDDE